MIFSERIINGLYNFSVRLYDYFVYLCDLFVFKSTSDAINSLQQELINADPNSELIIRGLIAMLKGLASVVNGGDLPFGLFVFLTLTTLVIIISIIKTIFSNWI